MANSPPPAGAGDKPAVPDIERRAAFEDLLSTDEIVLVDFYADWCGPCHLMDDIVAELANETEATVVKIDVETLPEVTVQYDIRGVPAFVAFEDGTAIDRLVGMADKAELRRLIE